MGSKMGDIYRSTSVLKFPLSYILIILWLFLSLPVIVPEKGQLITVSLVTSFCGVIFGIADNIIINIQYLYSAL